MKKHKEDLMRKISTVLHRYRLMTSIVALVLLLGALAVTPSQAQTALICENGCIGWNQAQGCVQCQRCCVNPDTGAYSCALVPNKSCD